MTRTTLGKLLAAAAVLSAITTTTHAQNYGAPPRANISFIQIDKDITLRRMVVGNAKPKGTVLFLHGFPETMYAWKEASLALGDDYEVHAFDWPGYGFSSRPATDRFSYAPMDYADVLDGYIERAHIDRSRLTIYGTDIGALPALLLALKKPDIARTIIVGDFAPFDRPTYMYASLQKLKEKSSADQAREELNRNRADILENAFRRGLAKEAQFELSARFRNDMAQGWSYGALTTADAFASYYAHFTRDQAYFEANLEKLRTPVKVVWGEKDLYIKKEMGKEFAERIGAKLSVLPDIGHYPHLQDVGRTVQEVRTSFQ
ncbi:alpha/beta fold hydrolase [Rhizobium bangladeshense]|uniref:alpha/beta fold hydrolase n=1 Tax=Rhizobium bangladeshense TaxID=1138189 RepID=UPI001C8383DA|nr:alpha/beta hydrolase [Rhizobium bangladeshense]MBX4892555.1 alpha/beta hydrolase [Rhizobium bangladeshense]MBX4896488.1 alpha/beta hydrolase [Rhizobium bangladeshense]MBX4902347.1 alpha/beta hydrolase [Rhizobium bangladeshense]MBX4913877.1 alpha/beta hydrolase [Rhizobium bangladeshense]MBX4919822.1 alpha/beta hydrolase [Rhizobium bangladeshense]